MARKPDGCEKCGKEISVMVPIKYTNPRQYHLLCLECYNSTVPESQKPKRGRPRKVDKTSKV